MISAILCGALSLVALYYLKIKTSTLNAIPGRLPLPFIGNLNLLLKGKPYVILHQLSQDLGGVYRLTFFATTNVVVSDPDAIYEVLVKKSKDFAGRNLTFRVRYLSDNGLGIALSDTSPELKARRKLVLQFLRMHGSGMTRIEEVTNGAANDMLEQILRLDGEPINPRNIVVRCVIDVIMILLTGQTLDNDAVVADIISSLDMVTQAMIPSVSGEALDMMPILRYLGNKNFQTLRKARQTRVERVRSWQQTKPDNGFLNYLQNLCPEDKTKSGVADEQSQINVIYEFLAGGIYTTSTTLLSLINVLSQKPSVQARLRKEVIDTLGSTTSPAVADRENMPYHQATFYEVGRFASIVPLGVPHKAVQDTSIGGYSIPKGTAIITNLWTLHHDEKHWEDPFNFNPERFLDERGQLVPADHPNRKNLMPFGAGERGCVGEVLAMSRMFLIVSRLIQNFEILPETSIQEQPSMDPRDMTMGVVLLPPEYRIRFKPL